MIKNIVFDLGNVLLNFRPKEILKRLIDDQERIDIFYPKIFQTSIWLSMDRGVLNLVEGERKFKEKHPEETDLIELFFANCLDFLTPIEENISLLPILKNNGYKLYVLSSFIEEPYEYVTNEYAFFNYFDGQIISFKEKYVKPDLEIYKILLSRYNLIPEETVFLDDHQFILEPAEQLGMKTICVTSGIDVKESLRKLGITI